MTAMNKTENVSTVFPPRGKMPAWVPEPPPHPGGKVLDKVQGHQNLQVNTFVCMNAA